MSVNRYTGAEPVDRERARWLAETELELRRWADSFGCFPEEAAPALMVVELSKIVLGLLSELERHGC